MDTCACIPEYMEAPTPKYVRIHTLHTHTHCTCRTRNNNGTMIATLLQPSPPGHGKVQKNQYKELITAPGMR